MYRPAPALFAAISMLSLGAAAHANLLASEDFSGYTAGPLSGQGTAANGFAAGWRPAAFAFFDVPGLAVTSTPVVNPGIVSSGGAAGGGFTRLYRDLAPAVAAKTGTQVTYVSFVGGAFAFSQVDLAQGSDNDADHTAEFASFNDSNGNIGSNIHVLNTASDVSAKEDISNTVLGNTSSPYGVTQTPDLYVIRFDPINRTVGYYMFYNGTRPTSEADASLSDVIPIDPSRLDSFDRIALFTVESPSTTGISNIRIGDTFADVAPLTALPEPASIGLVAVGAFSLLRRGRRI